MKVKKCLKE